MDAVGSTKSAHAALVVKACLLEGISYTKCSMTFVIIAVAILALAGGGAKNDFAPRPELSGVFEFVQRFWVSELKRVLTRNLGSCS